MLPPWAIIPMMQKIVLRIKEKIELIQQKACWHITETQNHTPTKNLSDE